MSYIFKKYEGQMDAAVSTSLPTLDSFNLPSEETYDFPYYGEVPAGRYWSEVMAVEPSVTSRGKAAVDICYLLVNDREEIYRIRLRYPQGSYALRDFYAAMKRVGYPPHANIAAAIGMKEQITLDYIEDSTIGSIVARMPYAVSGTVN